MAADLRSIGFEAPIIVLTGFLAPQVQREVDELTDVTALSKDTSVQEIVTAMRSTISGGDQTKCVEVSRDDLHGLTNAELDVLESLNCGLVPTEIAETLHISIHTVRGRIKSIYRKLSVGSLGEAIATATRIGILVPPT